jgi:hypothetical protein
MITLYPEIDLASVDAAIEILKKDKSIKSHMGRYQSYGYKILELADRRGGCIFYGPLAVSYKGANGLIE